MIYIEAIEDISKYTKEAPLQKPSLFLAGGITGCPNWQTQIVELLKEQDIYIFNPRRKDFPINDPNASLAQIKWEYDALKRADMILYWFPKETLCPIVLYELGFWVTSDKPIFIGMDKEYQRKQDVEIQVGLQRSYHPTSYSIEDLAKEVIKHIGANYQ